MKRLAVLAFALILGSAAAAQLPAQTGQADPAQNEAFMQVFHSISSHDLLSYVEEMSADKYRGRLSGSPEYLEVADWVADHLEKWGIAPGGDNGTYLQMFDMPYSEVNGAGALSIEMGSGDQSMSVDYSFPDDYYPGSNSDSGTVTAATVYVGYSITAPELGYDDYEGLDVTGKIVVFDSGVPYSGDNEETLVKWVPYSYHQKKLDTAKAHGAAGVLYIGKLANPNTSFNEGLIYAHIDEYVVDHLFFETGRDHAAVTEQIQGTMKPASMDLGKTATITADAVRHPDAKATNVIGILEGSDPVLRDEVIIIGAHLDAVGYLGEVFPGALDNASGSADVLALAKALAASPIRPQRSIMFLFIGGEEGGLVGSYYYTEHPVYPADKTVVFFNLDMVGHGTGLRVGGGETYPQIYRHFAAANEKYLHRPLSTSAARASVGRPRSDSVIFQRAGFRTMSVGTSGRVPEIPTYYHDPRDTAATLTPEIMEDVVKLLFVGLTGLANDTELSF
jgi:hypothetical protein